MAKPGRDNVQSAVNAWDANVNNNFIRLFDRPLPVFLHTGDETDLEAAYPAASHEECIVWVDHTAVGLTPYVVNKNHPSGSPTWQPQALNLPVSPVVHNATANLDWGDRIVLANPGGAITLTLRSASGLAGQTVQIKNLSIQNVIVDGTTAGLIDGANTVTLTTQYETLSLYSDGATWHILPLSGGGGGGGATAFTGLTDTPANYTGAGLQLVRVNAGETGLEFVAPPAGLLNYSLSEQTTGQLWHDGRTIYQKSFVIGALPNATTLLVPHGIVNLDELVLFQGTARRAAPFLLLPFPVIHDTTIANQFNTAVTATDISLRTGSNYSTFSAVITLQYVKV